MQTRILIVDDEQNIVDLLSQFLESLGYDCTATISPFEALEFLQRESFGLLLTDLKMPKLSGMELVRHAKEKDPDLVVVVVTALVDVTNAILAMRQGADDYVLKPFNLAEISVAVSRALEKRKGLIENRQNQDMLSQRVEDATNDVEQLTTELRNTKQYLENLLNSSVDAILTVDTSGQIEYVNRGAERMLGFTERELQHMTATQLLTGGADEWRYLKRILQKDSPLRSYETSLNCKTEGQTIPVNISFSMVDDPDGKIRSTLAICKDITKQKLLEHELKELSIRDSLTGLYNQRHFYERLEAEIERARRQKHPLSLLLFDIDKFKQFNDARGHLEGDRALQSVGHVVRECTREHVDMGFRYGGDEFTVILPEAAAEQAHVVAERIRARFEELHLDHLTLSMGMMTYREGYTVRHFVQFTDSMMYDAKRKGGNQVYVYEPSAEGGAPPLEPDAAQQPDK